MIADEIASRISSAIGDDLSLPPVQEATPGGDAPELDALPTQPKGTDS